jgi:hypothetical protein
MLSALDRLDALESMRRIAEKDASKEFRASLIEMVEGKAAGDRAYRQMVADEVAAKIDAALSQ